MDGPLLERSEEAPDEPEFPGRGVGFALFARLPREPRAPGTVTLAIALPEGEGRLLLLPLLFPLRFAPLLP